MDKLTIEHAAALATMLDRAGINAVVTELCDLEVKRRERDDEQVTQAYEKLTLVDLVSAMPGFVSAPVTFSVKDEHGNRGDAEQFSAWGGYIRRGKDAGPDGRKFVTFDLRLDDKRLVNLNPTRRGRPITAGG